MPEPPAMIGQLALELISCSGFQVTAVFIYRWDQLVGVVLIIIDLSSFKPDIIHTHFASKFFYILQLVLIRSHHKELKDHERCFTLQFFFPFHNVLRSFYYFAQIATYPVLTVHILGGPVN